MAVPFYFVQVGLEFAPSDRHLEPETEGDVAGDGLPSPELHKFLAEIKGQAQFLLYLADQIEESLVQLGQESDPCTAHSCARCWGCTATQLETKHQGLGGIRWDLPGSLRHRAGTRSRLSRRPTDRRPPFAAASPRAAAPWAYPASRKSRPYSPPIQSEAGSEGKKQADGLRRVRFHTSKYFGG